MIQMGQNMGTRVGIKAAPPRGTDLRGSETSAESKPFVGPEDVAACDVSHEIGEPGEFPYTLGIHRDMYRVRLWTIRQFAGFGTAHGLRERLQVLDGHGRRNRRRHGPHSARERSRIGTFDDERHAPGRRRTGFA